MPLATSFSQVTDTQPTLGITLTSSSPHNYIDEDGKTVILGEVQNTKNFPITGVKIWAGFYDEISSQPLETTIGTTILDVIPPHGKSPYMIRSPSANEDVTNVSVNLLGFNSSPPKQNWLDIETGEIDVGEQVTISGTVSNIGSVITQNTKVHLITYDGFIPPRVLGIKTTEISGEIQAGQTKNFSFEIPPDSRAISYQLVAESGDFQSSFVKMQAPTITPIKRLVTINDIKVSDLEGNRISDISVDSQVKIQSQIAIQYSPNEAKSAQPYVYYVQIKKSETGMVEFIGKAEGTFEGGATQSPGITWAPERPGLYFAETFVWNPAGIPLGSKGPISLLLVT